MSARPTARVYCATKHALEGLTKAMAMELGPHGIRVNTVCPTFIETPMTRAVFRDAAFRQSVLAKIKLGRLGGVEDVMGAVVFLASDASSMVTGTALRSMAAGRRIKGEASCGFAPPCWNDRDCRLPMPKAGR